jgi:hypothetical protein
MQKKKVQPLTVPFIIMQVPKVVEITSKMLKMKYFARVAHKHQQGEIHA